MTTDARTIEIDPQSDAERRMLVQLGEWRPIAITLNAQEIGALYATHTSPDGFVQYLLTKFKAAGVPVEGAIDLKLAHGKLLKLKTSVRGRGFFDYIWLPENYWHVIQARGGVN